MKKLTLDLDALRVDSFEPAGLEAGKGTVQAHDGDAYAGTASVYRPCLYTQQPSCTC
jgi:hypothetical protein